MPTRRNEIGNEPIHLNKVAAEIWKNADDCKNADDLLQAVTELYCLTSDSAEQEAVKHFIQQLIQMKLIIE